MRTSPCCPLRGLILAVLPLRLSYDLGSDATQALRTQSTDTSIEIGSSLPRVRSFQRPFLGRDYDGQPLTLCHDFSGSRSPVASCSARPLIVGYPALLSVVSQLLSVCVPSGLHGRERPCIKHAVPHERCGLSALIVGLHRACGIFPCGRRRTDRRTGDRKGSGRWKEYPPISHCNTSQWLFKSNF